MCSSGVNLISAKIMMTVHISYPDNQNNICLYYIWCINLLLWIPVYHWIPYSKIPPTMGLLDITISWFQWIIHHLWVVLVLVEQTLSNISVWLGWEFQGLQCMVLQLMEAKRGTPKPCRTHSDSKAMPNTIWKPRGLGHSEVSPISFQSQNKRLIIIKLTGFNATMIFNFCHICPM